MSASILEHFCMCLDVIVHVHVVYRQQLHSMQPSISTMLNFVYKKT